MSAQKTLICFIALFLLGMGAMGTAIHPAMAKEKRIVFHDEKTVIPSHEKVENVIVLGDHAVISGDVRTAVVVINGDLTIKKTADIHGSVFVLGGKINQEPGANVTEHVISVNMNNETLDSMIFAGIIMISLWITRLAISLIMIILTVLFGMLAHKHAFNDTKLPYLKPGKLILTGFLMMLALSALSLLLAITVIAIPLLLVILLGVFLSFLAGMVFISREIGNEFTILRGRPEWLKLLTGATIMIALASIPLLGGIVLLILSWYSLGLSVTWFYRKWKNGRKNKRPR